MWTTYPGDEQALINTLGHAAGVLIFSIFLFLALRRRSGASPAVQNLSLGAAALALFWNLSSLIVLIAGDGDGRAQRLVAGFGFSVLSILPAVLLRLCLQDRYRWLSRAAYALSGVAVLAHIGEFFWDSSGLHRLGLFLITFGFGVLTSIAALNGLRSDPELPRSRISQTLAAMGLFLFAMSFLHFGEGHGYRAWSEELAIHHMGIPVALFVLLQDYRFVLLDAFVRFLVNILLASLFGVATAWALGGKPFLIQALLAGFFLTLFALCRAFFQKVLTRLVFRQPGPERIDQTLRELRVPCGSEAEYFQKVSAQIADVMNAAVIPTTTPVAIGEELLFPASVTEVPDYRKLQGLGVQAVVPVRVSDSQVRHILLGERKGGRPYLSEDFAVLARMAASVTEQMEHVHAAETQRLFAQAELRALQAQIHPHFLFNALNTLYGTIPREAATARRILLNLADVFRYFLSTNRTLVRLAEEVKIVEAYLSIERQRLGDKLKAKIVIDEGVMGDEIPALSIQPLVENAVKHGAATRPEGGSVSVEIRKSESGLHVCVRDDGPGFEHSSGLSAKAGAGVGLENVSKRLSLCYGPETKLSIESSPAGSCVSFLVPSVSSVHREKAAAHLL